MTFRLADRCPRLGRARDDLLLRRDRFDREERRRTNRLLRAERLLAHRELQLIRAGFRNERRYVALRQRKLDAARRLVDQLSIPTKEDA